MRHHSELQNMGNEKPFSHQPVSLHSKTVTVWCGFTASFIVGPFFFEDIGPVTCTVNGILNETLMRNHLIPALQQRECVGSTDFMQDGAPPHIANPAKRLTEQAFRI
ncbi:hypothetical protein AVEN_116611-1 [Araneus ventricosus]|uniref:Tc1-like transposase DDE domain-containing protein n=1 Tax=Araneus ventricosus TaxID=182803 RepID=A0A4Y2DDY6_ARAVE|nr:hypothetical protein AVEN_116611-1 [Araneus ventricosus]